MTEKLSLEKWHRFNYGTANCCRKISEKWPIVKKKALKLAAEALLGTIKTFHRKKGLQKFFRAKNIRKGTKTPNFQLLIRKHFVYYESEPR